MKEITATILGGKQTYGGYDEWGISPRDIQKKYMECKEFLGKYPIHNEEDSRNPTYLVEGILVDNKLFSVAFRGACHLLCMVGNPRQVENLQQLMAGLYSHYNLNVKDWVRREAEINHKFTFKLEHDLNLLKFKSALEVSHYLKNLNRGSK